MYGSYENIPENIKKYLENLYGISYQEWVKLSAVISASFEKKKREAEREISLSNENDIVNPF